MTDVPELKARLQEIAGAAPSAKPIDARARRKIRVRQSTLIAVTALSVVALATTGFALTGRDRAGSSGERVAAGRNDSAPDDCVWKIATLGALSDDYTATGEPMADAVTFAVEEANEGDDLACRVQLRAEDSRGDPNVAPKLARKIVEDETVVACVCPYGSAETLASGAIFSSAGILMTSPATNETLDEQGFETRFGAAAPDDFQGQIAGELIASTGAANVAVIDDGQEYPITLTEAVRSALGYRVGGTFTIALGQGDNSRVVGQIAAMEPDYVFFGGYAPDAGPLLEGLREAGVAAPFMSGQASLHPEFGRLAGEAARGALVLCPCADPTRIDSAAAFVEGMRAAHGSDSPGTFAVEAYDVTTLVVEALGTYQGDPADTGAVRAHVVDYFADTQGFDGLAKTYSWDEDGNLEGRSEAVWIYEWDLGQGAFVSRGPASDFLD